MLQSLLPRRADVPTAAASDSARPPVTRPAVALLVPAVALVLLVLTAGPAAAHASLEGGSVTDGQVLDAPPEEIFLDFNESVTAPRAGLRVFDGDGDRVDVGGTFQTSDTPDLVRVALADDLAEGTYVVTYRVTSADGHPIDGALVFSIGQEAGGGDQLVAAVFSGDADRPYAIAAAAVRAVMYVGTLLAAGAAAVLWWVRREVVGSGSAEGSAGAARAVRLAAWTALVASAVGILLQTVLVTGNGLPSLVDGGALAAVLTSFVGISALIRIAGAGLLAWLARRGAGAVAGPAGLVGATAALGSLLLEGHTLTTGPAAVVWGGAIVHIAAGALWLGGLVVLAIILRSRRRADDPVGAGRVVARFSAAFTVSVIAVVAAGTALGWAEVRATRALFDTTYGLVLLAKVAAVVPLVGIGIYNNRRLVPTLTARRRRARAGAVGRGSAAGGGSAAGAGTVAGGSDEVATAGRARDAAWTALARTVRLEVGIIAVVLALTGVLVGLQPAAEAAGITGAYSETVEFPGIGQMTFTVDPNRAGRNEIHLYLLGDTGRPITEGVEGVEMRLSQPELDIGPIVREPIDAGPGHYILAGPELSVPGTWAITTEVALTRFDVVETTIEVTVNP